MKCLINCCYVYIIILVPLRSRKIKQVFYHKIYFVFYKYIYIHVILVYFKFSGSIPGDNAI